MSILVYKKIGETPLQALNRLRLENPKLEKERLSYAGRLDPLAEGLLLVLQGKECNEAERQKFLGLEKDYEVQVLFGFSTDSYDLLGIPVENTDICNFNLDDLKLSIEKIIPEFIGANHGLKYPPFSSKTIGGRPLFELARSKDGLPDEMPDIKGTIQSIKVLDLRTISTSDLKEHIHSSVDLVSGDFRQKEILEKWDSILQAETTWPLLKLYVKCESGVYMRSLAESLGRRLGITGLAFSIKRVKIGDHTIDNMA